MIQFEAALRKVIEEEIDRLRTGLESHGVIKNYDEYQYVTGQMDALKRVINSYFDDAITETNKR